MHLANRGFITKLEIVTGADPGIFNRTGPNLTQYVETVLELITFAPRQFSVIDGASHSIASATLDCLILTC